MKRFIPAANSARVSTPSHIVQLPFKNPSWWISFIAMLGFVLQDAIGSALLYITLLMVLVSAAYRLPRLMAGLRVAGVLPWLVPGFAILSVLWSEEPGITLRLSLEMALTVGIALYVSIENAPENSLLAVLFATLIACVFSMFIRHQYHDFQTNITSNAGIYIQKNMLGTIAMLCALTGVAIATSTRCRPGIRVIGVLGIVVGFLMDLSAREIATWIAGSVAMGYFAVTWLANTVPSRNRVRYLKLCTTLLILGSVFGVLVFYFYGPELLKLLGKNPTLTGRTVLWAYGWEASKDNPMLGVGYQAFWVQGHPFPEFLWKIFNQPARANFHFHNMFVFILTELGVVGVTLVLVYLIRTISSAARWLVISCQPMAVFNAMFLLYMMIYAIQDPAIFIYFSVNYAVLTIGTHNARVAIARSASTKATDESLARIRLPIPRWRAIWQHPPTITAG